MEEAKNLGAWKINVITDPMPQELATAFGKVTQLMGATYAPIACIGSQLVNGVNYAFLAEQTIMSLDGNKNIVVVILNVKPVSGGLPEVSLVSIQPVLAGSPRGTCGGVIVDPKVPVPEETMKVYNAVMAGFVGSDVKPFAQLATQVVKGVNYFLAAEVTPVYPGAEAEIDLLLVNDLCDTRKFTKIL
jgi:hypothetical protein